MLAEKRNMNVCAKYYGNPLSSCLGISLRTANEPHGGARGKVKYLHSH